MTLQNGRQLLEALVVSSPTGLSTSGFFNAVEKGLYCILLGENNAATRSIPFVLEFVLSPGCFSFFFSAGESRAY